MLARHGDRPLRVMIYSPLFPEYAMRLAGAIGREHDVLLVVDAAGREAECGALRLEGQGARVPTFRAYRLFLRGNGVLGVAADMMRTLRDAWAFRPDVVHFQECPNPLHYALLLMLRAMAKIVVTVHDPLPHSGRDRKVDRPATRRRIRAAAHLLLAHGRHCCEMLACVVRKDAGGIRETRHGVLLQPAPHEIRDPVSGRVLFFGRMEAYKGLAVLLGAAELLAARGVHFSLHLAGRGPELDRLRSRFEALSEVTLLARFLSPAEAIREFQEASVVALPYLDATQSGVTAAAFGNARPVIASQVGGLTDVVADQRNGLLVQPGCPKALADALEAMLSSPERIAQLRRGAQETAHTLMNWDDIAARTVACYRDVIGGLVR